MSTGRYVGSFTRWVHRCPHCDEEFSLELTAEQDRQLAERFVRAADDLDRQAELEATWELTPEPETDEES